MALKAKGKKAIQAFVDEGKSFNHESIKGTNTVDSFGKLPVLLAAQLYNLSDAGELRRVLYSYRTPIAWQDNNGEWTVPEVRYSATTTNHQNVARVAIDNPGFYANAQW